MKQNPPRKKTAAELEKERKLRDAEWWNRVIVYYLNQMYHDEVDRQVEKYRPKLLVEQMADYFRAQNLETLRKLTEKKPGEFSALELLQKMERFQEADSPFLGLMNNIRESPDSEEKLAEAVNRVVEEAPERILNRGRRNAIHIRKKQQPEAEAPREAQEEQAQEEERLRYELAFLRTVMSPERYQQLFQELVKQGRIRIPEREVEEPQRAERTGLSYDGYVAARKAMPEERDGELSNLDELLTAAAYMLAAYEQREQAAFDEKKADARAMELSGSKAFRLYMKDHPGSLLAAAQNTGLEATGADMAALEAQLNARDVVLASVRDALRSQASGQSAAYHRMTNALHRFVTAPNEPGKKEKDALALTLAQYVMTEGDPRNAGFRREAGLQAATALRALLPEKDFETFLKTANARRGPEEQITREMLDARSTQPREAVQAPEAPVIQN